MTQSCSNKLQSQLLCLLHREDHGALERENAVHVIGAWAGKVAPTRQKPSAVKQLEHPSGTISMGRECLKSCSCTPHSPGGPPQGGRDDPGEQRQQGAEEGTTPGNQDPM